MKTIQPLNKALIAATAVLLIFSSCQKEPVAEAESPSFPSETAIAIAASVTADGSVSSSDSIYAVNACKRDEKKIAIEQSALPTAIGTYIEANYSGSTFLKAFKIAKGSAQATATYVVGIKFNNKPVALQFDAAGAFVKVLELREKRDLKGTGWHLGGFFDHRDGKHRDTIALGSLSPAIKLHFSTTYAQDTLLYAVANKQGSVIVLSKNNDFYATAFTSAGIFLKRIKLPSLSGKAGIIAATALPANTQAYLSATYPNYVLHKAFAFKLNGTSTGYVVLIDANQTKYVLKFDTHGEFLSAVTVR